MTCTGSPKRVVFGPELVEIIDISTGNIIAKGVAIHASKAYAFSHFISFLYRIQTQLPFIAYKGIQTLLFPFADEYLLSNVSDSKDKEEDHYDLDIDIKPQEDLDLDPISIPT